MELCIPSGVRNVLRSRRVLRIVNWVVAILLSGSLELDAEELKPGGTLELKFPQLAHDRRDELSRCEVALPKSYRRDMQYPLVVWLEGGDGASVPQTAFLPAGEFVAVGLPFPKGASQLTTPHLVGDFPAIWKYHRAMLEEMHRRIPNLDRRRSILAGFSNGAHAIDGMLKLKPDGSPSASIASYFGIFILIEGGGWDVTEGEYPDCTGKFAYLAFGERSSLARVVPHAAKSFVTHGASTHLSMMTGTRHEFAEFEKGYVKKWVEEVALPGVGTEAPKR